MSSIDDIIKSIENSSIRNLVGNSKDEFVRCESEPNYDEAVNCFLEILRNSCAVLDSYKPELREIFFNFLKKQCLESSTFEIGDGLNEERDLSGIKMYFLQEFISALAKTDLHQKPEFIDRIGKILEEWSNDYTSVYSHFKERIKLMLKGDCKSLDEIAEVASLDLPEGYKPIRKLGKGGSGSVYLVENTIDKLEEAVKILTLSSDKGPEDVRRAIESELQVRRLNRLRCPYITMYYSVTYRNGKYLISMEPFEKTLEERLEESNGRTHNLEAITYFEELLEALAVCHDNGIVHKDLAPHNIGIDAEQNIKLSDFGDPLYTIDKRSKEGPLDYSSPRLLALPEGSWEVLPKDNVWSLGVILYEMLTGEKPFSSKDIKRSERNLRKEFIKQKQREILICRKSLDSFVRNTVDQLPIEKADADVFFYWSPLKSSYDTLKPVQSLKKILHSIFIACFGQYSDLNRASELYNVYDIRPKSRDYNG